MNSMNENRDMHLQLQIPLSIVADLCIRMRSGATKPSPITRTTGLPLALVTDSEVIEHVLQKVSSNLHDSIGLCIG